MLPPARLRFAQLPVLICAALFLAWAAFASPVGDLAHHFTDHLRHMGESLAFLEHGYAVFHRPYSEVTAGGVLPCPQHADLWGALPAPYPPLGLLMLWPFAAAERAGLLAPAQAHVAAVGALTLVALGVLLLGARAFRGRPLAARLGFLLLFAPLVYGAGANGFFDVAFVLAGLAGLLALRRSAWGQATLLFALAGALHFRALAFAPAALVAVTQLVRHAPRRRVVGVLLLAALLVAPAAAAALALDTQGFPLHNPLRFKVLRLAVFGALSLAATGLLLREGHRLAAATLGVCAALMVADAQHCWWHALLLCIPALALLAGREAAGRAWAVAWGWCLLGALVAYVDPAPPFYEWLRLALLRAA